MCTVVMPTRTRSCCITEWTSLVYIFTTYTSTRYDRQVTLSPTRDEARGLPPLNAHRVRYGCRARAFCIHRRFCWKTCGSNDESSSDHAGVNFFSPLYAHRTAVPQGQPSSYSATAFKVWWEVLHTLMHSNIRSKILENVHLRRGIEIRPRITRYLLQLADQSLSPPRASSPSPLSVS